MLRQKKSQYAIGVFRSYLPVAAASTDENESQPTISDDQLNDYYDITNDNNVDPTDKQMMTLFDSDDNSKNNSLDKPYSPQPFLSY